MRTWFRACLVAGLATVVLGVVLVVVSVTGRHDTRVVVNKRVPVPVQNFASPSPTPG